LLQIFELLNELFKENREQYIISLLSFTESPDDQIKSMASLILCSCLKNYNSLKLKKISYENIFNKIAILMESKSLIVQSKIRKGLLLIG
jgi:hypothetical protein